MLSVDEYLKNPCRSLSVPYWKAKEIIVPDNMMILHDSEFDDCFLNDYSDERYFRILHDMKDVSASKSSEFMIKTAGIEDFSLISDIVNQCYDNMAMSTETLLLMTKKPAYCKDLWILVFDLETKNTVGCGIADIDNTANEGIIEWVQVLPEYRRRGIGKIIVNELLERMSGKVDFATVSGKCDSESRPEKLYRSCGFKGNDIWHILLKK